MSPRGPFALKKGCQLGEKFGTSYTPRSHIAPTRAEGVLVSLNMQNKYLKSSSIRGQSKVVKSG